MKQITPESASFLHLPSEVQMQAMIASSLVGLGAIFAVGALDNAHAQLQMTTFRAFDERPDARIFVQVDFPRLKGGAEVLTYTEYSRPQMTSTGKSFTSSVSEISVRCADRALMHRTDILRSGRSGTGDTVQRLSYPREWKRVPDGTTAALLLT